MAKANPAEPEDRDRLLAQCILEDRASSFFGERLSPICQMTTEERWERFMEDYFELYRERFTAILYACIEEQSEKDLKKAYGDVFCRADQCDVVGDIVSDGPSDYALLAAFGLVLFDRLNAHWESLSKQDLFFVHEQIFECYVLSSRLIDRTEDARERANKQHAGRREAKHFVVAEWETHRQAYNSNKSAFARDYVRRVLNEYNVRVTEKQLREVWLLDALPASKPDGVHADG